MPYLVTTLTPHDRFGPISLGNRDKSRRAVATLDELRDHMRPILERSYPHGPAGNAAALRDLEGFSPILLDDGTVIEVERAHWPDLAHAARLIDRPLVPLTAPYSDERIIAAYNAAQDNGR